MSDNEVVRVLAEREGMTAIASMPGVMWDHAQNRTRLIPNTEEYFARKEMGFNDDTSGFCLRYLHAHDALRPVLGKLSHWEKRLVVERIALTYEASGEHGLMWYALTLPPEQLARVVAEAIVACRKEGGG